MAKTKTLAVLLAFFLAAGAASAAPKAGKTASVPAIAGFTADDMPYDAGNALLLRWPDGQYGADTVYRVFLSTAEAGGWVQADEFKAADRPAKAIPLPFWAWNPLPGELAVKLEIGALVGELKSGSDVKVKAAAFEKDKLIAESLAVTAQIRGNWFRLDRLNNLILLTVIVIAFFWAVSHAKRKGLFIRRIAGLDAIDEAIGRSTEMGKPIFYVPGIGQMSTISTIASTFILGEVAKKVASYDSQIKVPHYDPVVMTVAKEVVKQSYLEAGRPDSYREDLNFFVSHDQFSYAASVDGMISREKPAAIFFMGYFMAESLLLAEVGSTTGAIQIAGTDVEHQLPFFFTACDYTLIGEELYAAGAYLSKEPMLVSALKVQDLGKLVVMVSVAIGGVLVAVGAKMQWDNLVQVIMTLFKAY
jgi:hypothetical protein